MSGKIKLLIVDDEEMFRQLLVERFTGQDFEAMGANSSEAALKLSDEHEFDVGIIDIRLPGMNGLELFKTIRNSNPYFEAIILTGQASVDTAIEAMKFGVYDYLTKPCKLFELEMVVRKANEKRNLTEENMRLKTEKVVDNRKYHIVGSSDRVASLREMVGKAAESTAPVLVTGESGSGKEYTARAIHHQGKGSNAPFIVVNCGVYPQGILENNLFGYEKDAFTGVSSERVGWLQLADGGTIFLKDINELPLSTQVKLHRFLETGTFQKNGGTIEIPSTARVIASSEKDLKDAMLKKNFREDLYYKLNVITIDMPPLRDRKEDIPELIDQYLDEKHPSTGDKPAKKFSTKAINAMLKYNWPGNIRELVNVVDRAYIIANKRTIQASDIPLTTDKGGKKGKDRHLLSLSDVEKEHILFVLNAMGGNISKAARTLGISRPKLYRKITQYRTGVEN